MPGIPDRPSATRENDSELRIVIQNGEYWMLNKGDLAMLDVTVRRVRERWPNARIGVVTSAPLLLSAFEPEAEPIRYPGSGKWSKGRILHRVGAATGPQLSGPVSVFWLNAQNSPRRFVRRLRKAVGTQLRRVAPGLAPSSPKRPTPVSTPGDVPLAVRSASLVLAMGGGYLADVDPRQTQRTLAMLEQAIEAGVPTAMVGQGLGPLEDEALVAQAERVLPRVGLISLRESRRGPTLLADLAVPKDHVLITGDDAIELAAELRRDEPGEGLGICLRTAEYSPVGDRTRTGVRQALHGAAAALGAPLVPLIISEFRSEDRRSTLPLVEGFPHVVPPLGRYVAPQEVADRVSRCRVVVTGAYHLAVFALSQGIPVVGLTASQYYDDKLFGLAEMFGCGLGVVRLDHPGLEDQLDEAIRTMWKEAEHVRGSLRARADEQVRASQDAFERVFALLETGGRPG